MRKALRAARDLKRFLFGKPKSAPKSRRRSTSLPSVPVEKPPVIEVPTIAARAVLQPEKAKPKPDVEVLLFGEGSALRSATNSVRALRVRTVRSVTRYSSKIEDVVAVAKHQVLSKEAAIAMRGKTVVARVHTLDLSTLDRMFKAVGLAAAME